MSSPHEYHWTFGNGSHISFPGGGEPQVEADHLFNSVEGCATISDAIGNLLFYTDGVDLYDSTGPVAGPPLGGDPNSTHSAIIVPPAGGGTKYHIFAVGANGSGPVHHTPVSISGGAISSFGPTVPILGGPANAGEKIGVTSHEDCDKFWLAVNDLSARTIRSFLIDSDLGISGPSTIPPLNNSDFKKREFTFKFSPSGNLYAMTCYKHEMPHSIWTGNFDRATGGFSAPQALRINAPIDHYFIGIEFSPDESALYFTTSRGELGRHNLPLPGNVPISAADIIWTKSGLRALQLAPNGKIYGAKPGSPTFFVIEDPNNPVATQAGVSFRENALDASGGVLTLNQNCERGLPTFTRLAPECIVNPPEDPPADETCEVLGTEVNETIWENLKGTKNPMNRCENEESQEGGCNPLELPELKISSHISWGDSQCDCIESDDTEIMYLTLCNPYSNITLSNVTVQKLTVVDANGNPVPILPDGTPSVQLTPIGPYCFGDIEPCACVPREFVLRLRGAVSGPYKILVEGICFDACMHGDVKTCFTFDVCED